MIGSETVPVGTYTRTVLTNLDAVYGSGYSDEVLANVVSNEDSVTSIVTKVERGEADAGFVYITDALRRRVAGEHHHAAGGCPGGREVSDRGGEGDARTSTLAQQFADFVLTAPAQALARARRASARPRHPERDVDLVRRSDRFAGAAAGVATAVLFGFVVLPILAIFLRVPPAELIAQLRSPVVRDALGGEPSEHA